MDEYHLTILGDTQWQLALEDQDQSTHTILFEHTCLSQLLCVITEEEGLFSSILVSFVAERVKHSVFIRLQSYTDASVDGCLGFSVSHDITGGPYIHCSSSTESTLCPTTTSEELEETLDDCLQNNTGYNNDENVAFYRVAKECIVLELMAMAELLQQ
jgi:hypothetical protein